MSKDNSLVIANDAKGSPTIVGLGSNWPGTDGMFDRAQIAGGYVRVQPGRKVEKNWLAQDATKAAHDFVEKWVAEYGEQEGAA